MDHCVVLFLLNIFSVIEYLLLGYIKELYIFWLITWAASIFLSGKRSVNSINERYDSYEE
jgi:hypothetical protein